MDVFTHFALPFLVMYALRRRRPEALAAGIGGVAPDLDAVTFPVAFWDPLYFLGHRGLSHSLVGAPLFALGAVVLLRGRWWPRVFPLAGELRFPPRLVVLALAFSYTHLVLDWITMWGVPLFYPWRAERSSAGLFFYGITAMVPFSAYLVWRIARGTASHRTYQATAILLGATLVLATGVRLATRPEADVAIPAASEWAWTALDRTPDGWNATFLSWGRVTGNASYQEALPLDAAAAEALALAREHPEYRAFHLYAGGPEVAQVEARVGGGWNVTFLDLQVRTQVDRAPWVPFSEKEGKLRFSVVGGEVVELD